MESKPTQSKVSSLIDVFRGKASGESAGTASSTGGAESALALVAPGSTQNKRGRQDADGNANAPFTKLDLYDLLDDQEANYKKDTEISIAGGIGNFRAVLPSSNQKRHQKVVG